MRVWCFWPGRKTWLKVLLAKSTNLPLKDHSFCSGILGVWEVAECVPLQLIPTCGNFCLKSRQIFTFRKLKMYGFPSSKSASIVPIFSSFELDVLVDELRFCLGSGSTWTCHNDQGLGLTLYPVPDEHAWNWSASSAWFEPVGKGESCDRRSAVQSALFCLQRHSLDPKALPLEGRLRLSDSCSFHSSVNDLVRLADDLFFTLGVGEYWNCHSGDGFGLTIVSLLKGSWTWKTYSKWNKKIASGQSNDRRTAVISGLLSIHSYSTISRFVLG